MENKLITLYDVEQGSEAWHELRCGRITASKFKDMMSGHSTAGYKGLIFDTSGQIVSRQIEESYSNANMERGIELEPEARMFYETIKEVEVDEVGFVTNEVIYPEYIGVSPDGMIKKGNGLLEIKCPLLKTHVGYLLADKLPNEYKWQVQGQMLVSKTNYCDFMSYYPNMVPFIKRIYPDLEMQNQLLERMEASVDLIKDIVKQINSK